MSFFLTGIEDELKTLVNTQGLELKSRGLSCGFLEKAHETSSPSQPSFSSLVHLTRHVQLWPATEYLAMLWQHRMTACFVTQACLSRYTLFHYSLEDYRFSCSVILCVCVLRNDCWGSGKSLPFYKTSLPESALIALASGLNPSSAHQYSSLCVFHLPL